FNAYALPIVSAVLYALAMILTRTRCREENPLVLSLSLNVSFIATGLLATLAVRLIGPSDTDNVFLLGSWSAMGGQEWLVMALLVVSIIIGSVGAAIAYQAGPPATVAAFDFSYIGFASIWGIVLFAEAPSLVTVAGILLIVVGGILSVRR
ncbi:MAG TPA: EamA/RhaT family transporter, partial [Dongiaceae bacterium]